MAAALAPSSSLPPVPSATATCEMWLLPGRAIACQFHPEFPGCQVVLDKIHTTLTGNGRLSAEGEGGAGIEGGRSRGRQGWG